MSLPFEDLERFYEQLAEAIDAVGPQRETLFLAKLALTLAHQLEDGAKAQAAITTALQDLPPQNEE